MVQYLTEQVEQMREKDYTSLSIAKAVKGRDPGGREKALRLGGTEYRFGPGSPEGAVSLWTAWATRSISAAMDQPDDQLVIVPVPNSHATIADRFRRSSDMQGAAADALFATLFEAGEVAVPDWVREKIKKLSYRTLARWREHARTGKNRLASDPSMARKGTGVLERAEDGRLKAFCLAVYA
ncbi:MAG: hypothetical protein ABJP66_00525, partial [Hyphomicrobiales bacterium]